MWQHDHSAVLKAHSRYPKHKAGEHAMVAMEYQEKGTGQKKSASLLKRNFLCQDSTDSELLFDFPVFLSFLISSTRLLFFPSKPEIRSTVAEPSV